MGFLMLSAVFPVVYRCSYGNLLGKISVLNPAKKPPTPSNEQGIPT